MDIGLDVVDFQFSSATDASASQAQQHTVANDEKMELTRRKTMAGNTEKTVKFRRPSNDFLGLLKSQTDFHPSRDRAKSLEVSRRDTLRRESETCSSETATTLLPFPFTKKGTKHGKKQLTRANTVQNLLPVMGGSRRSSKNGLLGSETSLPLSGAQDQRRVSKTLSRGELGRAPREPGKAFSSKIRKLRCNIAAIDLGFRNMGRYSSVKMSPKTGDNLSTVDGEPIDDCYVRFAIETEAIEYFRRRVRIVLIALRWINFILQITSDKRTLQSQLKSFTDIAFEIEAANKPEDITSSELTFDRSYFKAKKEIQLSNDMRKTLTLRNDARSQESLKQVLHGLQALESLGEYPVHIQELLCRAAWYQQVEPKKAIIRQGHMPFAFYFILSGQAFVKQITHNHRTRETELCTVARLCRGQSFGETALLYGQARNATVESATTMELLAIGRDDFMKIFNKAWGGDSEPTHVQFLRQIPVLRDWPLEKIQEDAGSCLIHYFKRGNIITWGQSSQWIYIVKAGRCEVLKRLHSVKARSLQEISRHRHIEKKKIDPSPGAKHQAPGIQKRRTLVASPLFDAMVDYDLGHKQYNEKPDSAIGKRVVIIDPKTETKTVAADKPEEVQRRPSHSAPALPFIQRIPPGPPGVSHSKFSRTFPEVARPHLQASGTSLSATIQKKRKPASSSLSSDNDMKPVVFVTIETLRPGDVFGMNSLMDHLPLGRSKDVETPMCMVSRGAEVIMLSKKLYTRFADDTCKRKVQAATWRYPEEEIMQRNLQEEADWGFFKQHVVTDFVEQKEYLKTLLPVI